MPQNSDKPLPKLPRISDDILTTPMNSFSFLPSLSSTNCANQAQRPLTARQGTSSSFLPLTATLPSQAATYGGMAGCASCRKQMVLMWDEETFATEILARLRKSGAKFNIGDLYFGLGNGQTKTSDSCGDESVQNKWLSNAAVEGLPNKCFSTRSKGHFTAASGKSQTAEIPITDRVHVVDHIEPIADILDLGSTLDAAELHAVVAEEHARYAPVTTTQLLEIGQGILSKVELNTIWLYRCLFGVESYHLVLLHGVEEHAFYIPKIMPIKVFHTINQARTNLVTLCNTRPLEAGCVNPLQLPLTAGFVRRLVGAAALAQKTSEHKIKHVSRLMMPEADLNRWAVFAVKYFGIFIVDWPTDDILSQTELPRRFPGLESHGYWDLTMGSAIVEEMDYSTLPLQEGYLVELLGQLAIR